MKSISLFSGYIYLVLAIITGIASNGFLKTTEGFTKLNPTIFCVTSIIVCLFCISKAMTIIPDNVVSNNHMTLQDLNVKPSDVEEAMKKWLWLSLIHI